jgi:hypothetical protein
MGFIFGSLLISSEYQWIREIGHDFTELVSLGMLAPL